MRLVVSSMRPFAVSAMRGEGYISLLGDEIELVEMPDPPCQEPPRGAPELTPEMEEEIKAINTRIPVAFFAASRERGALLGGAEGFPEIADISL